MKAVIRNRNDALRFVDRFCHEFGPTWAKPQLIRISLYKPPRSLPQNAKLHAMIREFAYELGFTEQELKDYLKSTFGPKKSVRIGDDERLIPLSTTEYNKSQMSDMIAHVEQLGAEYGFRFSHDEI